MSNIDPVQAAADWYLGVLNAVAETFTDMGHPNGTDAAPIFVKGLARRGYMIETEAPAASGETPAEDATNAD